MSDPQPPQKTVNVMTVGMDSRKQAIFRMAFKMHTLHHYRLLEDQPDEPPHLAIFDLDRPDADSAWQTFRSEHPSLPTLIVTVETPASPPAPVLLKPIRVESLFPRLRQLLTGGEAAIVPPAQTARPNELPPPAQSQDTPPQPTASPQPAAVRPAPAGATWPDNIEYFDPRQGLLGALLQARRTRTPCVISLAGSKALIVLPELDRVIALHNERQLQAACLDDAIAVSSQPLTAEDTTNAEPANLTALTWQVALWTSHGRLIAGFPDQAPIRLRHWPNLTRLAPVPNGMRIAAFWSRAPANLRLTVRMLGLPAEQVFSFLAASYSIGILDSSLLKGAGKAAQQPDAAPAATTPAQPDARVGADAGSAERSGFLSRLLKKVAGL
ncbi:hypothetical protein EDC61_102269 [Sulfuritortus calidifontis]|uniref:Uncharacterized protein n=1 Tax=Sulfuritortus calidifontis TaxID=1914471 RepID=A0A4R3K0K0_9PROT|nr:hypothetical protein [Sulfuritortus calidifontis]TCS73491.1 hypothetical protein EDC61_102269 [Sulfuritortus calidifontis]